MAPDPDRYSKEVIERMTKLRKVRGLSVRQLVELMIANGFVSSRSVVANM